MAQVAKELDSGSTKKKKTTTTTTTTAKTTPKTSVAQTISEGSYRKSNYNGIIDEYDIAREKAVQQNITDAALAGSTAYATKEIKEDLSTASSGAPLEVKRSLANQAIRDNLTDFVRYMDAFNAVTPSSSKITLPQIGTGTTTAKKDTSLQQIELLKQQQAQLLAEQTAMSNNGSNDPSRMNQINEQMSQISRNISDLSREYTRNQQLSNYDPSTVNPNSVTSQIESLKRQQAEVVRQQDALYANSRGSAQELDLADKLENQYNEIQRKIAALSSDYTRRNLLSQYESVMSANDFLTLAHQGAQRNSDVSRLRGYDVTADEAWASAAAGNYVEPGSLKATMYNTGVSAYSTMTDKELQTYYYLLEKDSNSGTNRAQEYLDLLMPDLEVRYRNEATTNAANAATANFGSGAKAYAYARLNGLFSGVDYLNAAIDNVSGGRTNLSSRPNASDASRAITQAQADKLNEVSPALGYAYNIGTSMVDSAIGMTAGALTGSMEVTSLIASGRAAYDGYVSCKERGVDDTTSLIVGGLNGIAEALFEKVSIDSFVKMSNSAAKAALIKNIGKQSLIEGSEEAATTIANIITDALVLREQAENKDKSLGELLLMVVEDAVGGAISGGVFGTVGSIANNINYNRVGAAIRNQSATHSQSVTDAILADAKNSSEDAVRNLAAQAEANKENVSNRTLGRIAYGLEEAGDSMDNTSVASFKNFVEDEVKKAVKSENAGRETMFDAVDTETKRNVEITGITVEGKTVLAQDREGNEYAVSGLTFSEDTVAAIFDEAQKLADAGVLTNKQQAEAFLTNYDADQNVEQYASGFRTVMQSANAGLSEQQIKANSLIAREYLSPAQIHAAFRAANVLDVTHQAGKTKYSVGLTKAFEDADLTPSQRSALEDNEAQVNMVDALAKEYGMKIVMVPSLTKYSVNGTVYDTPANGFTVNNDGTIYISADAEASAYTAVAMHEMTHAIRAWNKDGYDALRAVVEGALRDQGNDFDGMVKDIMAKNKNLSRDAAVEEVIANAVPNILADQSYVDKLYNTNRSLWQKIKDFIAKAIEALTGIQLQNEDYRASASLQENLDALRKISDAFDRAARVAGENMQKGQERTGDIELSPKSFDKDSLSTYNRRRWAIENGVITGEEYSMFLRLLGDRFNRNSSNKTADGKYLVSVGKRNGASNVVIVTNAVNTDRLTIDRVYRIDEEFDTYAEIVRDDIYAYEREFGRTAPFINANYYSEALVSFYSAENVRKHGRASIERSQSTGSNGSQVTGNRGDLQDGRRDDREGGETESVKLSAKDDVEITNDLIAVHNLSGEQLQGIIDLGGFPMPSIAVIRANQGHDRYGDVSVIFGRETIDPTTTPRNKVYGGDAWTPTFPRIEYEADQKAAKRVRDKYLDLSKRLGYEFTRPMYRLYSEPDEMLRSAGGETALVNKFADDTDMMQIFLADSGKKPVDTVIKEEVSRLDDSSIELYDYLAEALGSDAIKEVSAANGESPIVARKRWIEAHGDALESAIAEYWRQNGIPEEDIAALLEATTTKEMLRDYIIPTRNYLRDGAEKRTQTIDTEATKAAIRNATNQEEYIKWLHKLLDGLEGKRGIYNGKDRYTSSGNQRSFNALHYEVTLENIVRAMRNEEAKGNTSFTAASGLFGLATKDYNSIDEIKADVKRLRLENAEEYEAAKKEYSDRLIEIADEIKPPTEKNSFISLDEASEALLDAVRRGKTKAGINRILNREYNGYYAIKPDTAQKIYDLVEDIKEMPTEYFEAKPERAVGLDEIKAVVMPEGEYKQQAALLSENGVPIVRYNPNIEGDRLRALNTDPVQELKFSVKDVTPADLSKLEEENSKLKDALYYANRELPQTYGMDVDQRQITRLANVILRETGSTIDKETFTDDLYLIFQEIAQNGSTDDAIATATEVGIGLMENALRQTLDYSMLDIPEVKELSAYLKNTPIKLTDEQIEDVRGIYGSYRAFLDSFAGSAVRFNRNTGASLEDVWKEVSAKYDWLVNTAETDPLTNMLQLGDITKPMYKSKEGYDLKLAAATQWLKAIQSYGKIMNKSETFADKMQAKLTDLRKDYEKKLQNAENKLAAQQINSDIKSKELRDRIAQVRATYIARGIETTAKRREPAQIKKYRDRITSSLKTILNHLAANDIKDDDVRRSATALIEDLSVGRRGNDTKRQQEWRLRLNAVVGAMRMVDSAGVGVISDDTISEIETEVANLKNDAQNVQYIGNMNLGQLIQLDAILRQIRHEIYNADKIFRAGRAQTVADNGLTIIDEANSKGVTKIAKNTNSKNKVVATTWNTAVWKNATPTTVEMRFGGRLGELMHELQDGSYKAAALWRECRTKLDEIKEKYHHAKWADDTKKLDFRTSAGDNVSLSREQALSIYAIAKREGTNQTTAHLPNGGFLYDDLLDKDENGKKVRYALRDTKGKPLSDSDLKKISAWLTDEQKAYADAVVAFMSNNLSGYGNSVSMVQNGVKKFVEKYYFPIQSDDQFINQKSLEAMASDPSTRNSSRITLLRNSGATKALTQNARNPIVLRNFDTVVSEHMAWMSNYYGMSIPQENIFKALNYKQTRMRGNAASEVSVRSALTKAHGGQSVTYLNNLLKDISGGLNVSSRENILGSVFTNFKKSKVILNASVVAQQYWAITKSAVYFNPKYFVGRNGGVRGVIANYNEAMQYSGTAIIKAVSGYDVSNNRNAAEWINGGKSENYDTKAERAISKAKETFDNVASFGAEYADKIAWAQMWQTSKREQSDLLGKPMNDPEVLKAAGKRFDYVMERTQVYDSVLSRSELMRTNSGLAKMMTAFAGEPTKTWNMIMQGIEHSNGKKGKAFAVRTLVYVTLTTVMTVAAKSAIYSMRDKDDEKTFVEKWVDNIKRYLFGEKILANMIKSENDLVNALQYAAGFMVTSDLSPVTLIPGIRDFASVVSGDDLERTDMAVIADLWKSFETLFSDVKTPYWKVKNMVAKLLDAYGYPGTTATRFLDLIGSKLFEEWPGEKDGTALYTSAYIEKLADEALESGDTSKLEAAKEKRIELSEAKDPEKAFRDSGTEMYKDEYVSAVRDGDTARAESIRNLLTDVFGVEDETFDKWAYESYRDDTWSAMDGYISGDDKALSGVNDLIDGIRASGKNDTGIRQTVSTRYKQQYLDAVESGDTDTETRIANALKKLDVYGNDGTRYYDDELLTNWKEKAGLIAEPEPEPAEIEPYDDGSISYYEVQYKNALLSGDEARAREMRGNLSTKYDVTDAELDKMKYLTWRDDAYGKYDTAIESGTEMSEEEVNDLIYNVMEQTGKSKTSMWMSIDAVYGGKVKDAAERGDEAYIQSVVDLLTKIDFRKKNGDRYYTEKRIRGWID